MRPFRFRRPNLWWLALDLSLTTATDAHAVPVAAVAAVLSVTATSFVAIAVTAVINIGLSLAASFLINTVFGPNQTRQAQIATLAIGEQPRTALFGRVGAGGSLADMFNWGGSYGTDWECRIIPLADHRCKGLVGFYVNDQYILYPDGGFPDGYVPDQTVTGTQVIDGETITTTNTIKYKDQLQVWFFDGSAEQTLPDVVTNGGWSTTGNFRGITLAVVAYKADTSSDNPVWSGGRPSFLWVVDGALLYDPRKDDTVGGSGPHRWNDPSTREYADNASLCRYNWVRGIYALDQINDPSSLLIGRGLSALEAPPVNVFAYANICDEPVALKAGGYEPRYRVSGAILSNETYIDVEQMFADAMGGVILQPGGSVEVEPGHARAISFAFTDDDLIVGSKVSAAPFRSRADNAWVNTVLPRYTEPSQKWQDHAAPVRRVTADVTADKGARELTLSLAQVTSGTQAQRLGEIQRRLGRLVRTGTVTLGPRFSGIEEGDWGTWTSSRHLQGATVTFRVDAYKVDEKRQITLTLREISIDVFDWDAETDELTSDIQTVGVAAPDMAYLNAYGVAATVNAQVIATSYPSSDLTIVATAGTTVSIAISAHHRIYTDETVAIDAGTVTGTWAATTTVYLYYDDAGRAGGDVTYHATTAQAAAVQGSSNPARHYVGSVTIPASGTANGVGAYPIGTTSSDYYN